MSTDEIDRLHNDIGFIYTCKDCQKNNTTVKTLCDSGNLNLSHQGLNPSNDIDNPKKLKRCTSAPQLKIPKLRRERIFSSESAATDQLLEELSHPCLICNFIIAEDDAACLKCNHICHSTCMDPDNSDICVSCAAADNQIQVQHTPNTESFADKSSVDIISKQPVIKSTSSENCNQTNVNSIDNGSAVVLKPSSESANVSKSEAKTGTDIEISVKHKELRQLESKLKKWENELKLGEAKINENSSEIRRLQDYIQKVEARNYELETTIKTLYRKINLLETEHHNPPSSTHINRPTTLSSNTDQLIIGVHNQVTRFLMGKVARQISQMEAWDAAQSTAGAKEDNSHFKPNVRDIHRQESMHDLQPQMNIPSSTSQPIDKISTPALTEVPNFRGLDTHQPIIGSYQTLSERHHMQNIQEHVRNNSRSQWPMNEPNVKPQHHAPMFNDRQWSVGQTLRDQRMPTTPIAETQVTCAKFIGPFQQPQVTQYHPNQLVPKVLVPSYPYETEPLQNHTAGMNAAVFALGQPICRSHPSQDPKASEPKSCLGQRGPNWGLT